MEFDGTVCLMVQFQCGVSLQYVSFRMCYIRSVISYVLHLECHFVMYSFVVVSLRYVTRRSFALSRCLVVGFGCYAE